MTVTVNPATKKPENTGFATIDPKHMIAPIYGSPNSVFPTICMNVRPNTPNWPMKKKVEPAKTSSLRKLVPVVSGLLTFSIVLSLLIICMDTSEIRLQKFRLNMTRDEELNGIEQDDSDLVKFIRWKMSQEHKNVPMPLPSYNERSGLVPDLATEIFKLANVKEGGIFVESLTYHNGPFLTAPWLAENFGWNGLIVEPEARKYFSLCKETLMQPKVDVIQACVSSKNHPKEIMLRDENEDSGSEVQISSLISGSQSWFYPRAKCYPLYSLMLAVNHTRIDLLSLGCQGQELEILRTIPFDKVSIKIISIHLNDFHLNETFDSEQVYHSVGDYEQMITKFLQTKSYKLVKMINKNYIYRSIERSNTISKLSSVTNADKSKQ